MVAKKYDHPTPHLDALNQELKKKRGGRPKGSKNKKIKYIQLKPGEKLDSEVVAREGQYKFVSDTCDCVFFVTLIGCGMFCEHKNEMHLETDKR